MNGRHWIAFWFLSLIWGASFMLIEIRLEAMAPLMVVAFRMVCGALALWAF
ncbi:hypothetical protein KFU94_29160 [Chloroflexi bacterium TSY]|nr:hypothetical protein [Chloroflexi bacterium TSY]